MGCRNFRKMNGVTGGGLPRHSPGGGLFIALTPVIMQPCWECKCCNHLHIFTLVMCNLIFCSTAVPILLGNHKKLLQDPNSPIQKGDKNDNTCKKLINMEKNCIFEYASIFIVPYLLCKFHLVFQQLSVVNQLLIKSGSAQNG